MLSLVLAAGGRKFSKSLCGLLSAAAPDERIYRRKVQGLYTGFVLVFCSSRQRESTKSKLRQLLQVACPYTGITQQHSAEEVHGDATPTKPNCPLLMLI